MSAEQKGFDEGKFREDYAMLETAKTQLDALIKQQQLIQMAIEEHVRARETIRSLVKGAPGDEILIPVGADSYVHAKISDNRDAVVGVGSATSIRRKPEEAEKILDSKIDDLSRAFKSVSDRAGQTDAYIQELSDKVQQQYELLQSGAQP